jgi:Ca2+-binding RTX toxin-like protein
MQAPLPFTSLVIVDSAVKDYQILTSSILPKTNVIVLDANQDGIEQITEILDGYHGIESIHVLSHGDSGTVQLGSVQLNHTTIAHYGAHLQRWAAALTKDAAIVLYGCNVAATDLGKRFVRQFSRLTGAPVAASTTLTGSAALGGDWNLSFVTGPIQAALAFQPDAMAAYPGVLADETVFLNETFKNTTVTNPNWIFGIGETDDGTPDNPYLTAGTESNTAPAAGTLPGTPADVTRQPDGSGALRLTSAKTNQAAFVLYDRKFKSDRGLSITFDFFAYGGEQNPTGDGADGLSVFLVDGGTTFPTNPTAGAFGGSLGYAQKTQLPGGGRIPGINNGYVGIGFDEFGNFSNRYDTLSLTPGSGVLSRVGGRTVRTPDSIAIRGKGDGLEGYRYIAATGTLPQGIDNTSPTATRNTSRRRVEIDLSKDGLLSVKIDLNGDKKFDGPGEQPFTDINLAEANGDTQLPQSFKLGFAAGTGDITNFHEIQNLTVTSGLNVPPIPQNLSFELPKSTTINVAGLFATDEENDAITAFTIKSLPPSTQGALFLKDPVTGAETPVALNTSIPAAQINNLFFTSTAAFTGTRFTYTATETTPSGTLQESTRKATVSLNEIPSTNVPPIPQNLSFGLPENVTINVSGLFAVDPNPTDTIASFTIQSLPPTTQGKLYLGDPRTGTATAVTAGTPIAAADINNLFFTSSANFTGTRFTYTATDSQGAQSTRKATVSLNLTDNIPPSVTDASATVGKLNTTQLTGLSGSDPDGTIQSFSILTLPPADQGTLYLGDPLTGAGTPVTAGQPITPEQINQLFFRAASGFTGSSFTYDALDNRGATSNLGTVTLNLDATQADVCPPNPSNPIKGTNAANKITGVTGFADQIIGRNGNDTLKGLGCPDTLEGNKGNDRLIGGTDNDQLFGNQGNDIIRANNGNDRLEGGLGRDKLYGGRGIDVLYGQRGEDSLLGKQGDDIIRGGKNKDGIYGGANNDFLDGQQGNDVIRGGSGQDFLNGGLGPDLLVGNAGNDTVEAGRANDNLRGQSGQDQLFGRRNNDRLFGGSQADVLVGGGNRDVLVGGGGNDTMTGGPGPDRYVYNNPNHGKDIITDFQVNKDLISLQAIFNNRPNLYTSSNRSRYVKLKQLGTSTLVKVDANGNAPRGFKDLFTLLNVNTNQLNNSNLFLGG